MALVLLRLNSAGLLVLLALSQLDDPVLGDGGGLGGYEERAGHHRHGRIRRLANPRIPVLAVHPVNRIFIELNNYMYLLPK